MLIVVRVVIGFLLLAHGLVHLLYLAPGVPEFSLDRSWLVPGPLARAVGLGLVAATVAAFALVALVVWGVPWPAAGRPVVAAVAGLLSAVLLVLFWDVRLVFGLAIDVALVAIVVARPGWAEQFVAGGG
jgi:hypothetical protein